MIRIAWITTGFAKDEADSGGAAAIHNLARELSLNTEIELTIFSFYYPLAKPEYKFFNAKVYSFAGKNVHNKLDKPGIWRRCIKKFDEEHKIKNFDVIHSIWAGESGNIAAKLCKKFNIPLIVNICGGELAEIKEIGYGSRLKFWQKRFVDNSISHADKIVSGSDFILNKIKQYYGTTRLNKSIKIPFGVDDNIFYPNRHSTPSLPEGEGEMLLENKNKRFKLINIANAVPVKSHETLFKAVKKVSETFPEVKLDVYGKDEGKFLKKLVKETGTEGFIKLNSFIEHNNIAETLNHSGIFVLSSLYESQNMALIEAAFCGLPIVSTDAGAANEVTEHIVKSKDYAGLTDKIIYIINNYDDEKKKALGKITKLHEKYSLHSTTNSFIKLYKEMKG